MRNQLTVPHIPNAMCEVFEERATYEIVLHLRTLEHRLYLVLDGFRLDGFRLDKAGHEITHLFADLFHRMSRATSVLPSGIYETRNPNDFAL